MYDKGMTLVVIYSVYAAFAIVRLKSLVEALSSVMTVQKVNIFRALESVGYLMSVLTAVFYVSSFLFYLYVLKRTDLSLLLPVQMLIFTFIGAFYDLRGSREFPQLQFFLGVFLAMIGLALILRYLPRTV